MEGYRVDAVYFCIFTAIVLFCRESNSQLHHQNISHRFRTLPKTETSSRAPNTFSIRGSTFPSRLLCCYSRHFIDCTIMAVCVVTSPALPPKQLSWRRSRPTTPSSIAQVISRSYFHRTIKRKGGLESSMARYVHPFRTLNWAQIIESEIFQVSN